MPALAKPPDSSDEDIGGEAHQDDDEDEASGTDDDELECLRNLTQQLADEMSAQEVKRKLTEQSAAGVGNEGGNEDQLRTESGEARTNTSRAKGKG